LCYTEDVAAAVDMNLVMNAAGEFIELQGTGEEATFTDAQLTELLALGKAGIRELLAAQQPPLPKVDGSWQKSPAQKNAPASAVHAAAAHPPRRGGGALPEKIRRPD
jgi:hypothetical protein